MNNFVRMHLTRLARITPQQTPKSTTKKRSCRTKTILIPHFLLRYFKQNMRKKLTPHANRTRHLASNSAKNKPRSKHSDYVGRRYACPIRARCYASHRVKPRTHLLSFSITRFMTIFWWDWNIYTQRERIRRERHTAISTRLWVFACRSSAGVNTDGSFLIIKRFTLTSHHSLLLIQPHHRLLCIYTFNQKAAKRPPSLLDHQEEARKAQKSAASPWVCAPLSTYPAFGQSPP
jgi:hypothetical protein